jgi:putative addiction module CopG family antidote
MLIGRQLDAFLGQPAQTRRRFFNDVESVGWEQRLASSGHSDDRIDVLFHSKVSEQLGNRKGDRVGFNPTLLPEVLMRTTQQLSITLPNEMAELVRAKVATGEYATESEVIREGLRTLLARDRAVEGWLREQVAPAYDALKADPSRAVSAGDVRATLAAEHRKAAKKR